MKRITVEQADAIIRAHGIHPSDFWADRATKQSPETCPPKEGQEWIAGSKWFGGPLTALLVYTWLGY